MRPVHVAVPLAALAAVLTRWPDPLWGGLATVLAALWVASAHRAEAKPNLHLVGPAAALALLALPVAPAPLVALPGAAVGIAVGLAVLTALPRRHAATTRFRFGAWAPAIAIAALVLVPLVLPLLVGPERIAAADRFAPATLTLFLLMATAATTAYVLLTRKEATA